MSTLKQRIASLSPEKRALLEERLRQYMGAEGAKYTIPRRTGEGPLPLSSAQERLWFIDQLEEGSPLYNVPIATRLQGELDVAVLRQALAAVVERHEVVRTTYIATPDGPVQQINPARDVPFELDDVSSLPEPARLEEALEILRADATRPFDLSADLMLRTQLVRLDADDHLLLTNMHHIASDGWSSGIINRELSAFYASLSAGKAAALPPLPIQYADYAVWQRARLESDAMLAQRAHWEQHLSDLSPLNLPTDKLRPTVQTHRGAQLGFSLPAMLTRRVEALGRSENATSFMLLLAAFKVLLYRYTGQTDVAVGMPVAGRPHSELEGLIGFFVNTVVARTDLAGQPSFRETLRRVREESLRAFMYQDLPFDQVVQAVQPARDRSRSPLFQVMFAVQNMPFTNLELPGVQAERMLLDTGTAKFDLQLQLYPRADELRGRITYNTDLFERETMMRLAGHYRILLEAIVADPDASIATIPLLTDKEQGCLYAWNETAQTMPAEQRVHRLFEEVARTAPEAIAVQDKHGARSYAVLNERANQVARYLRSIGITPGDRVGICLERSADLVLAMLAVLKAGASYVPLDPVYPSERLGFMCEDAGLGVLLTETALAERQRDYLPAGASTLCLDDATEKLADLSTDDLPPDETLTPESEAYVIYTSGSTGQPKGVSVPHRAIVHLVRNTDYIEMTRTDVIAQAANASFDAVTFEVWGALLNGARLVVIDQDVLLAPGQLATVLRTEGVTTMFVTTALFNHIARGEPRAFKPLRTVLFGGERVEPRWVREVMTCGAPQRLLHVYGPTETTTFATWHELEEVAEDATNVPIGKPLQGTTLWVLDGGLRPVPVGIEGELYIGGLGVALGYLERPELTAERFIPDPFSNTAGARLYRTGDVVRRLADGEIEFIGRVDRQVKLRGFRIEPGEIESALMAQAGVEAAVVQVVGDDSGERRLIGYVTAVDPQINGESLRRALGERLPPYMVPSAIVVLETLPLTANGKIDRAALPLPDPATTEHASASFRARVTPPDALESQLILLFEEVLQCEIDIADNFFDRGGHSLLAARLMALIEERFDKRFPLSVLFEAPSPGALAQYLRAEGWQPRSTSLIELHPGPAPYVYIVHGVYGSVIHFRDFARRIGRRHGIYGVQARGLDGAHPPHTSIEEMARHYVEEITALQPDGPYFLIGYSLGGSIVYEMAQQLEALGKEVALTVMLDSGAPPLIVQSLRQRIAYYRYLFWLYRKRMARRGFWAKRARMVENWLKRWFVSPERLQKPTTPEKAYERKMKAIRVVSERAYRRYKPTPYAGRLLFVKATAVDGVRLERRQKRGEMMSWPEFLPQMEVFSLNSSHMQMYRGEDAEPLVSLLIERMEELLPAPCTEDTEEIHHGDWQSTLQP